jgi:hypothetical protein
MISLRHAPATCVLLAFAIVPTVIHSYAAGTADDGRRTSAVPQVLAGMPSKPSERNPNWGKRRFDSDDWMERNYQAADGGMLRLTVIRSADAKAVYHHPELAVAYGTSFVRTQVVRFPERPDVPVYVLTPGPGVEADGLYVLHYDTRFVENPISFQLRTAGELLFSRRKPMTLFFVNASGRDRDAAKTSAAKLLFAAVDSFVQNTGGTNVPPSHDSAGPAK